MFLVFSRLRQRYDILSKSQTREDTLRGSSQVSPRRECSVEAKSIDLCAERLKELKSSGLYPPFFIIHFCLFTFIHTFAAEFETVI